MTIQSKLKILTLRTQRGKTFTCINHIQQILENDGKSIHVVLTQNTFMNQAQFLGRIDPTICISFGSKAVGARYHANNLNELIGSMTRNSNIAVVVCCLNITRLSDFRTFFSEIKSMQIFGNSLRNVYMYFDEIHETIHMCKPFIEEFSAFHFIQKMTAITATPENIARELNIEISTDILEILDETQVRNKTHYYKIKKHNNIFFENNDNESTLEYTIRVLKAYMDDFYKPYARNFVPSHVSTASHMQMKDEIFKINKTAIVIVINTEVKALYFYDGGNEQKVDLFPKPKKGKKREFKLNMSVIIADILRIYGLSSRPLFITGHECISVGVTFCGAEFGSFTNSVIYFPNMQGTDLYQFAGRTTGNIKNLPNFQQTTIFTTQEIHGTILKQEEKALELEIISTNKGKKSADEMPDLIADDIADDIPDDIAYDGQNIQMNANSNVSIYFENIKDTPVLQVEPIQNTTVANVLQVEKQIEITTVENVQVQQQTTGYESRYKSRKRKVIESDSESKTESENSTFDNDLNQNHRTKFRLVDYSDSETCSEQENQVHEINGIEYLVFKQELDAIEFMRRKCHGQEFRKARKYPGTRASPIPKRYYGNSVAELNGLTCSEIALRKWGLESRNKYRKIYSTVDNKYVVYWKK